MSECKWMQSEICVNADCPLCAEYCPVPDDDGVCRFEDRSANDENQRVLALGGVVKEEANRLAKVFAVAVGKNADIIRSELSKKLSAEFDRLERLLMEK